MPEEKTARVPRSTTGDLEARVADLEKSQDERGRKVDEMHAVIVGSANEPGWGERLRAVESFVRTVKGIGAVCVAAAATAWTAANVHIGGGPPATPPGHP